jgi:hypothetical protein
MRRTVFVYSSMVGPIRSTSPSGSASIREQLDRLHFFCMKKLQGSDEIEIVITVKETFTPALGGAMQFFAQADKQTNQTVSPYTPSGWGKTMLEALSACVREISRFPYQAETDASTNSMHKV